MKKSRYCDIAVNCNITSPHTGCLLTIPLQLKIGYVYCNMTNTNIKICYDLNTVTKICNQIIHFMAIYVKQKYTCIKDVWYFGYPVIDDNHRILLLIVKISLYYICLLESSAFVILVNIVQYRKLFSFLWPSLIVIYNITLDIT